MSAPLPCEDAVCEAGSRSLLPGEVAGVTTSVCAVEGGGTYTLAPRAGTHSILFLITGAGAISCADSTLPYDGFTTYVGHYGEAVSVRASTPTSILILGVEMGEADEGDLAAARPRLPHVMRYSDAPTYREAIKSAKTTSRTVLPTGIVPRCAAGSVLTQGPDAVAPHAHPMLEQFFLGLPATGDAPMACTVTADGVGCMLTPLRLLHIPLGSTHGVTVEDGAELHYLWIDVFREKAGEAWIATMHTEDV